MKHSTPFIAAFILILSPILPGAMGQSQFSPEAYKEFRQEHRDYTAAEALADHPLCTYYSLRQHPTDPQEVPWFDSVNRVFRLTAAEMELLSHQHFMITERISDQSWANALVGIYNNDLPVFLSTDFFLNTLHQSYDIVLQTIEWQFLEPNLKELLQSMYDYFPSVAEKYGNDSRFEAPIGDADLYICVALSLLTDQDFLPRYGGGREQYDPVMEAIAAGQMVSMPLFTAERTRNLDFSQFVPRGHYNKEIFTPDGIRTLEDYFRSMMWLGRIDFLLTAPPADGELPWTEDQLRRMQLGALLVNETLYGCGKSVNLEKHEKIISAMVGPDDNLTPAELKTLAEAEIGTCAELFEHDRYEAFKAALNASDDFGQKIMSNFFFVDPDASSPDQLPVSFKLLGQKFLLDSYVFSEVVFDRIVFQGEKVWRPLPDPLDVMAALGNDDALHLIEAEMEKYKYAANLAGLRYLIESYDQGFWEQSLYNVWLAALRSLNPDGSRDGLPYFMQTTAWHHEKINTQLASWAQLRHDNLLYGKQSYTGGVSCSFPFSYVEPYPEFFGQLAGFADMAADLFGEVFSGELIADADRIVDYYNGYAEIMETLMEIARKERTGSPLDEDEIAYLKSMMTVEMHGGCAPEPSITGWFNKLYFDPMKALEADFTVADVHTQPTDRAGNVVGNVLHVGNGLINMGVFLASHPTRPGELMAYAGPVSSFHQEVRPQFERLTDQQWELKFYDGNRPDRPDWVSSFLLNADGFSYPEGRKLRGSIYTGTGGGPGGNAELLDYLILYPNPSKEGVSLCVVLRESCDMMLEVFDTSGRLVHSRLSQGMWAAEHHLSLPAATWQRGLYLVRVSAGAQTEIRQLLLY